MFYFDLQLADLNLIGFVLSSDIFVLLTGLLEFLRFLFQNFPQLTQLSLLFGDHYVLLSQRFFH